MRTSKRQVLIDAALQLIEDEGLAGLTYDSLASTTGISKSGVIYHFPSRHNLLLSLHEELAKQWTDRLEELAGGKVDEVALKDRLKAMLTVHSEAATLADLLLNIDAVDTPEYNEVWEKALDPWLIDPCEDPKLFAIQLMANGLWIHDYVSTRKMTPEERQRCLEYALQLVEAL